MVHIGGTRTDRDTDLTPRPADREKLLQHAYHTMPALKVKVLVVVAVAVVVAALVVALVVVVVGKR